MLWLWGVSWLEIAMIPTYYDCVFFHLLEYLFLKLVNNCEHVLRSRNSWNWKLHCEIHWAVHDFALDWTVHESYQFLWPWPSNSSFYRQSSFSFLNPVEARLPVQMQDAAYKFNLSFFSFFSFCKIFTAYNYFVLSQTQNLLSCWVRDASLSLRQYKIFVCCEYFTKWKKKKKKEEKKRRD